MVKSRTCVLTMILTRSAYTILVCNVICQQNTTHDDRDCRSLQSRLKKKTYMIIDHMAHPRDDNDAHALFKQSSFEATKLTCQADSPSYRPCSPWLPYSSWGLRLAGIVPTAADVSRERPAGPRRTSGRHSTLAWEVALAFLSWLSRGVIQSLEVTSKTN